MPIFHKWDGGSLPNSWSFGYLTGKDHDLICIKPSITNKIAAEMALSPVCTNWFLAISAFMLKRLLLRLDENMGVRRYFGGNPSKEYDNQ